MAYFAPAYMRLLYRFLQLPEESEHRLFAGVAVDARQLMQADSTLSFEQQMAICRNALAIAEPGLGLRMGTQLQLAAHGALGTAVQHADTLDLALDTFAEFVAARASFINVRKYLDGDRCVLELGIEELGDPQLDFVITQAKGQHELLLT